MSAPLAPSASHAPPLGFEEMMVDAARRILTAAPGYDLVGTQADQAELVLAYEAEHAQLRSWSQTFPSTAGPWSGIGGSALTALRVSAVQVGSFAAFYCAGVFLYVLDLTRAEALAAFRDGQAFAVDAAAPYRPSWDV